MLDLFAGLGRDATHGFRLLGRNPGYTLIVTLTLALGIGATTAIFSVLYATVLGPLPYPDPGQLVRIEEIGPAGRGRLVAFDRIETWRDRSETIEGAAFSMMGQLDFTMSDDAGAQRIQVEQVDFHTLSVLGVQPVLGRWFRPDEVVLEGGNTEGLVISHGLWQTALGGDPDVIGKTLPGWRANWGTVIIGVMPPGFYVHPSRSNSDAWGAMTINRGPIIGRLKPGVRLEQAQAELATMGQEEAAQAPGAQGTSRVQLTPLHEVYRSGYAQPVYMLLGAVFFVLLIASVNVANLQLNRGIQRQGEMAVRAGLGAGRWQLFRGSIVENVPLMLIGGALGVLVAFLGIPLFVFVAPDFYPPSEEIGVNTAVLLFALGLSLATGILAGLIPAFRGSIPNLAAMLKEGGRGVVGRGQLGIRRALVVAEIALAMVLLVGAGLMINSYARLTGVDMGFDPDDTLTMEIDLFGMDRYRIRQPNDWTATPEISRFYTTALERIRLLPGVESVASTSSLPPRGGMFLRFGIVGGLPASANDQPMAVYQEVSPAYFETMRIPLVRGRPITDLDSESAPGVAIVNEAVAREYFGNQDPIGQRILVDINSQNPELENDREREIVGVVQDTRISFLLDPIPAIYVPYLQSLGHYASNFLIGMHARHQFVVRTSGDTAALALPVRRAFAEADPGVAPSNFMPMRTRLAAQAGAQEFWMRLLGIFAALGTFLAAIGVYGVISYAVEQRRHEFGIRTTLGAGRSDILRLVLGEGFVVVLIGLGIGIGGAFGATRLIANQLYGVEPMDPATVLAVALLLLVVALLACYIPGRRATKLDPLAAIRTE